MVKLVGLISYRPGDNLCINRTDYKCCNNKQNDFIKIFFSSPDFYLNSN